MAGELSEMARSYLAAGSKAPFEFGGFDHLVILVGNMAEAMDFYCKVLGCKPGYSYEHMAMEQVWCGPHLIVLIDISDERAAYATPEIAGGRNMDHFCVVISTTEREVLRKYLADKNIEIEREAVHGGARGMGESTYILDPWGNRIELKGPALI